MAATQTLTTGNNFLTSFNTTIPKLYITAETDTLADFDQITLKRWQAEGFSITYLPYGKGGQAFTRELQSIGQNMGVGDSFGIIAYGDAATACLELFRKPTARLVVLVAYYPTAIPDPLSTFPIGIKVLVHLTRGSVGVTRNSEVLGIQGKRKTVPRNVPQGTGIGGMLSKLAIPSFVYEGVEPGFAEHDLEEYDKVAERIAWSRSLDCVRKAFKSELDLERLWEDHLNSKFKLRDVEKTMETMGDDPCPFVNNVPVLTGGMGQKELHEFYKDFFIPGNPPSFNMKLVSRTIGVDKVVDEVFVTFDHTQEMPWILPSVPATNKHVEIALVSIVSFRGGKLYHEHVYWDQASVLLQVGLLDRENIPRAMKEKGLKVLPVAGKESARKVLDERSEPSNEMIDDW